LDQHPGAKEVESRAGKRFETLFVLNVLNVLQSYCCGATNVFAWIALCAGVAIIFPQQVMGMTIFYNPSYAPKPWHAFLLYQAANTLVLLYNIYVLKRTMWIHDVGCKCGDSVELFLYLTPQSSSPLPAW
jgi:choline transport protein